MNSNLGQVSLFGESQQKYSLPMDYEPVRPDICEVFEENVPSMYERLEAMRHVASAGYPIRAVMMPIIPVEGWQILYRIFPVGFLT